MNELEELRRRFPRGTRVKRVILRDQRHCRLTVVEGVVLSVATGRNGHVLLVRNAERPLAGAVRYSVSEWEPIDTQEAAK